MTDTIGGRIEAALAEKNMTRKELVEKSGIGKSSIYRYIKNEAEPTIDNIYKLSSVLNVSTSWLSGFEYKDFCGLYKKDGFYELYEICSHKFCAYKMVDVISLTRKNGSIVYYKKNNSDDSIEFEKKIEKILDISGMMIKELSEKTGIHPNQITAYKHGRRNPSLSTIETLAEALRVSPSWLAGFSDVDTRNTYIMRDNPNETIYIHPSQYVITKIEDNGNKITLKKIQKE